MSLSVSEPTDQLLVAMSQLNVHLSNTTSGIVISEKVQYCIFLCTLGYPSVCFLFIFVYFWILRAISHWLM